MDKAFVDVRFHSYRDDSEDDESHNHGTLNIVCDERDAEAAECYSRLAHKFSGSGYVSLHVYIVVTMHSVTTAQSPLRPVSALMICWSAESSATI